MPAEVGADGGDCPRCGATTTQVGHDRGVVATLCERCNLLLPLTAEAMSVQEAVATDWSDYEPPESHDWGPDPMP